MTPQKPLQYVEMEPAHEVSHLAVTYWGFAVHALPHPGFVHRVWPDGCVTLALAYDHERLLASVVVGARTTASEVPVHVGQQFWGIRFRPESGGAFCGKSAEQLRDARFPARELLGASIDDLAMALRGVRNAEVARECLDAWLGLHGHDTGVIDALVSEAVRYIVAADGMESMERVAQHVGLTLRQLQRRFRAATGLTPKEYAIIRRARAALKRVTAGEQIGTLGGWAQLALASGFADQAHLARECSRLLALTPTGLVTRLDDIAHDHLVD